ncbi:SIS domain-containing protein [Clostridium magnum]|uniref:Fructosamine deglycase FrlB n=1 Tax=Clostridium magnum DSM 2767 TaxID=1121326 RepID=A0A161X4Z0_9CLOT|nr:SIS domain-containing protein [Clostridium magnum]KZL89006.1 fructosamine deglycase FrlB [Clostridium magnum DSM 2767]SHI23349.1 fructoselysine 6-phosphate deglycase [Clostridium magnum DSM 2767]
MDIIEIISEIKAKMDFNGGLKAVYFVACGGSMAAIYPGKYLLDSDAKNIATKIYSSNEFVHTTPKSLDKNCICIICSLKATAETVEAVKVANEKGAVTIAMTGSPDTEMAKNGQYSVIYSNGDNQIYSKANQALALKLCFEILYQFENYEHYEKAMNAYKHIDSIVNNTKDNMQEAAQAFAEKFKDDSVLYVLGCGPLYGTAYTMVSCHLMEMQCKHAVLVHSGEYFHGPFETTDKDLAMILLMSTGRTRAMDERTLKFMKKYADRYIVIDAKDTGIDVIDESVAEFFNSVIMIPIERFFVSEMAKVRGHSMDYRRYMWKLEY